MKRENRTGGTIIPRYIRYNRELTHIEKDIFETILDRENGLMSEDEAFYCYQEWFAENLGYSIRSVKQAIKGLEDKKYIIVTKGKGKGCVRNLYQVNEDKMEELDKNFALVSVRKQPAISTETALKSNETVQPIDCSIEEKESLKSPETRSIENTDKEIRDIDKIDRVLSVIRVNIHDKETQDILISSMFFTEDGKVVLRRKIDAEFDMRKRGIEPPARELAYIYTFI